VIGRLLLDICIEIGDGSSHCFAWCAYLYLPAFVPCVGLELSHVTQSRLPWNTCMCICSGQWKARAFVLSYRSTRLLVVWHTYRSMHGHASEPPRRRWKGVRSTPDQPKCVPRKGFIVTREGRSWNSGSEWAMSLVSSRISSASPKGLSSEHKYMSGLMRGARINDVRTNKFTLYTAECWCTENAISLHDRPRQCLQTSRSTTMQCQQHATDWASWNCASYTPLFITAPKPQHKLCHHMQGNVCTSANTIRSNSNWVCHLTIQKP
jgi:hypothetical protein